MDFPCNDEMITAVGVQISTFMLVLSRETSACNQSGLPARSTVKTLNIGTPRPATVVVLNIKQFNFTMK